MAARIEYTPALVSWNLTRACNLRWPHCYMEGGTKAENDLTTEECLSPVSGPDPLLHPYLTESLFIGPGEKAG